MFAETVYKGSGCVFAVRVGFTVSLFNCGIQLLCGGAVGWWCAEQVCSDARCWGDK